MISSLGLFSNLMKKACKSLMNVQKLSKMLKTKHLSRHSKQTTVYIIYQVTECYSNDSYLGTFFATRVELGGRLHATEDSAALGNASVSEKSKAMKAAASLSFSSPWVQASATASSASSSASKSQNSDSSLNVGMMWEAKGGDTLLCNKYIDSPINEVDETNNYESPSAWCATVASFYNWRVVKVST